MYVDIFSTNQKYSIIYADPPWSYKTWSGKGKEKESAENHYPCMKKEDIQALPIERICADDCVLFLWVTFPCLEEGLELIRKWGFTYALPFWQYLARRICAQYERDITMASLFDGIGGFPLVFERCGAKAVWASEIEEFPMAVTKMRFKEEQ